jgi:hypothetical protein
MRTTYAAFAALLIAATTAVPASRADAEAVFQIRDRLAPDEIAEATTVYVDDQLVQSFHLDGDAHDITVNVTVPDGAGEHHYALCGQLLLREPDGTTRKQSFAVGGMLSDVGGREFEAFASNDFTKFYLVETTAGRPPTVILPEETHACVPAVS